MFLSNSSETKREQIKKIINYLHLLWESLSKKQIVEDGDWIQKKKRILNQMLKDLTSQD